MPFVRCVFLHLCFAGLIAVAGLAGEKPGSDLLLTYEGDARPIFKAHCFHCHGESDELAGGLDLRLRKLVAKGGDSGAVIVPGKPEESLLIDYVSSGDMPPSDDQRLSEDEVALLRRWVSAGAPAVGPEPDEVPEPGEFFITHRERSHWAFQPIEKPAVPRIDEPPLAGANPVDAFVARKLEENGLRFSAEADRVTLIRRATFDLLGLPPTPEEVQAFLEDDSPDAYVRLIDRLLESPHYGERWGRHWLDVAGYADSEGYTDDDPVRPDAWMYRDYVIRSFNDDKPWDWFITEQLAGDELARATHASAEQAANTDAEARELLIATGFLRMAPDGTGSRPMDLDLARQQTITQTLNIVSSSLLGMTVGCAECHDHRFDPIPQDDFYRLRAIFAPVFDHEKWRPPSARRVALMSPEDRAKSEELETKAKALQQEHDRIKQETVQLVFERVLETIPEDKREFARETFNTPAKDRTPKQVSFIKDQFPMINVSTGTLHLFLERYKDGDELKAKYEKLLEEANKLRAEKPQPDYIRIASEDTGHVPTTHVYYRGDFNSPQPEPVEPGGLTVLAGLLNNTFPEDNAELPTTGRRLAFARTLTSGKHPLVPRVLINRFWMHHFGRGLVESMGDFGMRATPPSHPQLLDWLAADFVENGWSLKHFHRLVMTSRTYRQSSRRNPEFEQIDADNRLLWRMPVRRLEAEAVRDAILAVTGQLNRETFGQPLPVAVSDGGLVTAAGGERGPRRSIYIQVRRTQPVYMLEAFDSPQLDPNCERRVFSTVATQSLTMLNDPFILQQSEAFAGRILQETPESATLEDRIIRAWQLAFSRKPTPEQLGLLTEYVTQQRLELESKRNGNDPQRLALASLCQVIFGSNRFLYVD